MAAAIAEAPATVIGKLLTEAGFSVPTHQGNYRWKEDEVRQLFDDIMEAIDRPDDDDYFLGLMVFMQSENGELIVLDGQQRLATSIMILSAVRNWLQQYSEYKTYALQIQERYIGKAELGETEVRPRLRLNIANNYTFENYVVQEKPVSEIEAIYKTHKRFAPDKILLDAVLYCHSRINQIVQQAGNSQSAYDQLMKFVKYLIDRVYIIRLLVSSESNAYMIFETLNDRGMELSPLDLVKNYLFGRAASRGAKNTVNNKLKAMETRWVQMLQTLANVKAATFLKAYWTSRNGRTQKAKLFDNLKNQYKDADSASKLTIDMLAVAEQYAAIESGSDPVWSAYSLSVRETIGSLKTLGAEQTHPVILSGLAKFKPREFERLIRLLEILIVRYQLIGGGRTGGLEIVCARLARLIYVGEIKFATEAFQEVRDIYPSDREFQENFATKEERTSPKAAYILKGLEQEARRREREGEAKELDPGPALTVEHILPKRPTEEWLKSFRDREEADEAIYRIGNLCLVARNKDLGRDAFNTKKAIYSDSDLVLRKDLSKHNKPWDMRAVEQRQAKLASYAVTAWRFQ